MMKKDVVAGLGEIGLPILKILSKKEKIVGYDINKKLMNENKFSKLNELSTSFLHIAIPVTTKFDSNVISLIKFKVLLLINSKFGITQCPPM